MVGSVAPITLAVGKFAEEVNFRTLPDEVIEMTRDCFIDWLGNALAGSRQALADPLTKVATYVCPGNEATIVGRTVRSSPAGAAMINATFAHAIDYDDVHLASGIHASAPIFAAVLAVAEAQNAPIEKMIEAFAVGHEVMARMGVAIGSKMFARNSHPTGTLGYFGAAIAVAKLLGLDARGIANAIGIAGGQAGSFTQVRGTMSKPFFAGHAAFGGVLSATMASFGFVSAFDLIEGRQGLLATFDAPDEAYDKLARDLGLRWEMLNNAFKVYASCAMSHAMIDGILDLKKEGLEIEAVKEIRAGIMPFATSYLNKPDVRTGLAGKFSAQYCAAVAVLDGKAQEQQFTDDRVEDPQLKSLMSRVTLVPVEGLTMEGAEVEVLCVDGRRLAKSVTAVTGSPAKPVGWETLTRKFSALADQTLPSRTAKDIVGALSKWPIVDVTKLMRTTTEGGQRLN